MREHPDGKCHIVDMRVTKTLLPYCEAIALWHLSTFSFYIHKPSWAKCYSVHQNSERLNNLLKVAQLINHESEFKALIASPSSFPLRFGKTNTTHDT